MSSTLEKADLDTKACLRRRIPPAWRLGGVVWFEAAGLAAHTQSVRDLCFFPSFRRMTCPTPHLSAPSIPQHEDVHIHMGVGDPEEGPVAVHLSVDPVIVSLLELEVSRHTSYPGGALVSS